MNIWTRKYHLPFNRKKFELNSELIEAVNWYHGHINNVNVHCSSCIQQRILGSFVLQIETRTMFHVSLCSEWSWIGYKNVYAQYIDSYIGTAILENHSNPKKKHVEKKELKTVWALSMYRGREKDGGEDFTLRCCVHRYYHRMIKTIEQIHWNVKCTCDTCEL